MPQEQAIVETEFSGVGTLETVEGQRYPVRYYVRSYVENPSSLYDSYGRIVPTDPEALVKLMTGSNQTTYVLVLSDGSRLPIQLISSSGSIRVRGVREPAVS